MSAIPTPSPTTPYERPEFDKSQRRGIPMKRVLRQKGVLKMPKIVAPDCGCEPCYEHVMEKARDASGKGFDRTLYITTGVVLGIAGLILLPTIITAAINILTSLAAVASLITVAGIFLGIGITLGVALWGLQSSRKEITSHYHPDNKAYFKLYLEREDAEKPKPEPRKGWGCFGKK